MKRPVRAASLAAILVSVAACAPPLRPLEPASFAAAPAPAPQPEAPRAASPASAATSYKGLGAESVPPEVLARYRAGALDPQVSRRIQSMLDVRSPGAGMLSPDGKRMFFTWSVTGTQQVWRLDAPMGFPTQLTGGEESTSIAGLTPDGKTLFLSRDRNGEENPGLYAQSTSGGPLTVIQHKAGVQTFLDLVADDGKSILYRANDKKADQFVLYRYDLEAKKSEVVFSEEGLWSARDERKGQLLLEKSVGSNMAELYLYEPATKKLSPLIGQGEREDYVAAFGAKDGEVLVLTPKLGEYRRLYSLVSGKLSPVTPEQPADVSAFSIDRARKRILYTVNQGGYTKAFALDAATKKPIELPKLPAADHVTFGTTTRDGKLSTVTLDPGVSPPESYVVDWGAGRVVRWHKPSAPEIDTTKFARVKLESYPARDGAQIPMFVRRPETCTAPCPVIVSFHGGPEGQSVAGFSTRAQLFVDAGFVYVEPNVRGSDGYGKTWLHADDGPKRLRVITDIEDVSKFIRDKWAVGGKAPKIGVYGGSYGGYSTLVAMSMFAGAYDVGVSVVGISSLTTFLENTAPYRRALRASEYGDPEKDRQALVQLSPITYVDRVRAPLMLVQGATDPRVPVGEALQFHDALAAKGVPTELIVFPDEGHGMRKRQNQVLALGHTLRFFEQHLK
jgi:dipeptidyl aminopeptidase/acylaminoacyl peptidase